MGLRDWFRKLTASKSTNKSKGGSQFIHYKDGAAAPKFGFTEESKAEWMEERENAYTKMFGEVDSVLHELLPLVPHIDVYRFAPNETRDFYTYVTGGMSDLPMDSPPQLGAEYRRAELIFYADEDRQEYAELLRWLARFVHDNETWLHWGHTMPNGQPPQPLFGTTNLDSLVFMPSILRPDNELGERLQFEGEPVNLIWCVPITSAECQLKLEQGVDALYSLFQEHKHPFVFAGDRASYI